MLRVRKILYPLDDSDSGREVLTAARRLAARFSAQLTVIHVRESDAGRGFREYLDSVRRERRVIADGEPAGQIIRLAGSEDFDLVMMPTHGHGRFQRLRLGRVACRVLQEVDPPVWTVASGSSALAMTQEYQRLVCAVSLSPNGGRVFSAAAELASAFGAGITVVHAAEPHTDPAGMALLRNRLRSLVEMAGIRADLLVERGAPERIIRHAVQATGANLLVIGRSRAAAPELMRTISYTVVRDAPCPVWNAARISAAQAPIWEEAAQAA